MLPGVLRFAVLFVTALVTSVVAASAQVEEPQARVLGTSDLDTPIKAVGSIAPATDTLLSKKTYTRPLAIKKPKGPKPIRHEFSGGLRLNTNGTSLYGEYGTLKAKDVRTADMFHNVRFWQLEITEKKHPAEIKIASMLNEGNKYIYGKINNFYAVKLGYGYRKLIVGKPDPGTISIHWVVAGGLSLGMLKPYYLNVYSDPNAIKYADPDKEQFLDQILIEENAGFSKGLSEMKIVPGGHLKTAIHLDFSTTRTNVYAVEAGVNFEYYGEELPIMANNPALPYFYDLFLAVQFGKRW